jgi:hypothetical protein
MRRVRYSYLVVRRVNVNNERIAILGVGLRYLDASSPGEPP